MQYILHKIFYNLYDPLHGSESQLVRELLLSSSELLIGARALEGVLRQT
jgi:hypothetical protein